MATNHRDRRRHGIASGIQVAPALLLEAARLLDQQADRAFLQADELLEHCRLTREEARRLRSLAEDYDELRHAAEWIGPDIAITEDFTA